MYLGSIVEYGTVEQLFNNFAHPYSKALLASVMIADPDQKRLDYKLSGEIPSSIKFAGGLSAGFKMCGGRGHLFLKKNPDMVEIENGHFVKCHHAGCKKCKHQ